MKMNEIKALARERGINPGRLNKIDLVRAVQREEGNIACFETDQAGPCAQANCLWREDCG